MANPYFMRALTSGLADSLQRLHEEKVGEKKRKQDLAKEVYGTLLKFGNADLKKAGLAGLAALAENEDDKFLGTALEKLQQQPHHEKASKLIDRFQAPPEPPAPVTEDDYNPSGVPLAPTAEAPATPIPAKPISPPPAAPSSAAQVSSSPTQGGQMNLSPSVSPPPEAQSDYSKFFQDNPYALSSEYAAPARIESAENLASQKLAAATEQHQSDWANRLALAGLQHQFKLDENTARNLVSVSPQDAERYGLPAGGQVDIRLLSQLHQDTRSMDSVAARKYAADLAGSRAIQAVFTGNFDESGTPMMAYVRKDSLLGKEVPKTPSASEERVTKQAGRTVHGANDLLGELQNPEVANRLGPVMGRITKLSQAWGNPDPQVQEFMAHLESWLALQPALHGFRGINALDHFEKLVGSPITTPEALAAAIRGITKTAKTFTPSGPPPSPAAATTPAHKRYNPATGKIE
jgi:hypothetical protein